MTLAASLASRRRPRPLAFLAAPLVFAALAWPAPAAVTPAVASVAAPPLAPPLAARRPALRGSEARELPAETERTRRLEAWLRAGGAGGLEAYTVRAASASGGVGLFAREALEAGSVPLVLPPSLHIWLGEPGGGRRGTVALATLPEADAYLTAAAQELEACKDKDGSNVDLDCDTDLALLALALAYEQHLGEESRFAPYIDLLPRGEVLAGTGLLDPSWLWPPERREALPPAQHLGADAMDARVDREHAALLGAARRTGAETLRFTSVFASSAAATTLAAATAVAAMLRGRRGLKLWRWARATVFGRAFQFPTGPALIPMVDAANHAERQMASVFDEEVDVDPSGGSGGNKSADEGGGQGVIDSGTQVSLICGEDVQEGEEITISYGALSNSDLLVRYGFQLPERHADECEVAFEVPDAEGGRLFVCELPVGPSGRFAADDDSAMGARESHRRWCLFGRVRGGEDQPSDYYNPWGVPKDLIRVARDAVGARAPPGASMELMRALCDQSLDDAEAHMPSAAESGAAMLTAPEAVAERHGALALAALATEIRALQRLGRALAAQAAHAAQVARARQAAQGEQAAGATESGEGLPRPGGKLQALRRRLLELKSAAEKAA